MVKVSTEILEYVQKYRADEDLSHLDDGDISSIGERLSAFAEFARFSANATDEQLAAFAESEFGEAIALIVMDRLGKYKGEIEVGGSWYDS